MVLTSLQRLSVLGRKHACNIPEDFAEVLGIGIPDSLCYLIEFHTGSHQKFFGFADTVISDISAEVFSGLLVELGPKILPKTESI